MSEQKDLERARVVDAMCMTWRHDFGLDRKEDELGSCGMTDTERDALRRQMGQLYDHHLAARSLPVGVPEARVTGAWESARIGDFNAGWNACRDSVLAPLNKAAYMELDTTKRSIAIQDELRALLNGGEA